LRPLEFEPATSVRAYLVDTAARIVFYVPAIGVWEKWVAGMENGEVLRSRTGAVLVNLVAGRLHGKVREWLSGITGVGPHSPPSRKLLLDTLSGSLVGLVTYGSVLYLSGASLDEAAIALPFGLLFTSSTGRPFGRFLDLCRRLSGTTPVLNR
jgi:hypothetical protein